MRASPTVCLVGTGLIFAAVVVAWLAYFVPLALRRYDEASRAGSVDRFTGAMRVLRHRRTDEADAEDKPRADPAGRDTTRTSAPRPEMRRSARVAARRRRRTLLTLLAAVVVVAVLAALVVVPLWAVAVPVALVVAWLVTCRVQVRGERGLRRTPRSPRSLRRLSRRRRTNVADEHPDREHVGVGDEPVGDPPDNEATVVLSGQIEDHEPHREHVMEQAPLGEEDLQAVEVDAVPVTSPTGATLWDPVPVTLPTYVTKPRAARTIRTIEFGQPGAWTSGHVQGEETEMPEQPASESEPEHRRAVGD